jgi:hypothetical protein
MNTNFPLKVVCPTCRAAIGAKCLHSEVPLDPFGFSAHNHNVRWVDWFHFERIEKAKAEGFNAEETT